VLSADEDDPAVNEVADLLTAGIPGAERARVPGSGHMANLERPEAFNDAVLGFFERVGTPPARDVI
jgi:3-oxoadipate enol-lactonase